MTLFCPELNLSVREQVALADPCFQKWTSPDGSAWALFYRIAAGYLVRFPQLADFLIAVDGQTISAFRSPAAAEAVVEHLYLNQVLPLAMSRQHKLVLHASAIELNNAAVAFMGESGRGKSTLAASFSTNGSRFLTDDGLQLELEEDVYLAKPSHPSIRLWEDARTALIPRTVPAAPPLEYTSKARMLAGTEVEYCNRARPLRAIYLLGDGSASAVTINKLAPLDAMMALLKHCFLLDIEEQEMLKVHFGQLTALARSLSCFALDYPRDFAGLPAVRARIIEHAALLTPKQRPVPQ